MTKCTKCGTKTEYSPPEGMCIVPIATLKHWLELVDLNPKDLAPRIDAYVKDSP